MRCDDLVFQIDTNNNQVKYRTRATWWRSRPAHNPQRSNGAGPPCHPRTPPKAAQPTAQIRAAVQTMLTAKRNVGTTCEPHIYNVKRRWRVASAGSWPFALSEIGAKPNTGKDLGTKLLEIALPFYRHIRAFSIGDNKVVHSCFGDNSHLVRLFGDRGSAVVLSISDTRYSRIVKRSRKLEKKFTSNRLLNKMRYP